MVVAARVVSSEYDQSYLLVSKELFFGSQMIMLKDAGQHAYCYTSSGIRYRCKRDPATRMTGCMRCTYTDITFIPPGDFGCSFDVQGRTRTVTSNFSLV
jgi:hypothetical protein